MAKDYYNQEKNEKAGSNRGAKGFGLVVLSLILAVLTVVIINL